MKRPRSCGPCPYRIVMVGDDGKVYRWTAGFKTRENAQREADRLNERPDEYRYEQTAEVRGPS